MRGKGIVAKMNKAHTGVRMSSQRAIFGKLYERYGRPVYRYVWQRVDRNREIAEDLMQETFLRAFEHFPQFRDKGHSYLTYLITIARNLVINYYRNKKPCPLEEGQFLAVGPAEKIEEIVEQKERKILLEHALRDLSPTEKEAIRLKYSEDLRVREIATLMQKTENAIKLVLSRARKKLAIHPLLDGFSYGGAL